MTDQKAQEILNKIIEQIFGYKNPYTLEQFKQKYAFDLKLPVEVFDSTTGESTWAISANPSKFITMKNASAEAKGKDFMVPKRDFNTVEEIIAAWQETNLTTTERYLESINIAKSDNIYGSDGVYNSQDIVNSKNLLFCGSIQNSEFVACSQRSNSLAYCIRAEDSKACSNSFNVIWSNKISNSFFIQDCFDLQDCIFCSHLSSKQYCIANMQFDKEEYLRLKDMILRWILSN